MAKRINVGCGQTPTAGWRNYDNSMSTRLAHWPKVTMFLSKIGFLGSAQIKFIEFCKQNQVFWADVTKHIPETTESVEVLYSSHMLEHLDRIEVQRFLKEAKRVLMPRGVIRLAVPNLKYHINHYLADGDADAFIEKLYITKDRPRSFVEKVYALAIGDRHHQWMYDGASLCKLLQAAGFEDAQVMEPGFTSIPHSGALDLRERESESVFVEAIRL